MRLLRHLEVIVVEADRAEADRDEQHDPDIGALEIGPQQRRAMSPERIIRPPIVGVPFLVRRCEAGPSARIGWPLPCLRRSAEMTAGTKEEHEEQRRRRRAGGAKGDITKDVERAEQVRVVREQR